jgi:hypothetical protein
MFLVMTTSSFNQKQVGSLHCVLHLSGILTLVNIFYVGGLKHPYVISRINDNQLINLRKKSDFVTIKFHLNENIE